MPENENQANDTSHSESLKRAWEARRKKAAERRVEKAVEQRSKPTMTHSERMKKAWETRRKNLQESAGAKAQSFRQTMQAVAKEKPAAEKPSIGISAATFNATLARYLQYVDAARALGDTSILESSNFRTIEGLIKEFLVIK
jgi:ferritin-like metal-binding protein YciE